MNALVCVSEVSRGDTWHSRYEKCGKPAKGTLANGDPACGVHLRQERLEVEHGAARRDWDARIAAVKERLGISVWGWEIGRAVAASLEDLERLAEERG